VSKQILFTLTVIAAICAGGCSHKNDTGGPQDHPVRALYLAGINAFNSHDVETLIQQFANDFEMYTNTGWHRGLPAIKERFGKIFQQFPSVKMEIEDLHVREVVLGTAIVDFRWKVFPKGSGPAWSGIGTGVYVFRSQRWLEVLEHESVVHVDEALSTAGKE
jgi:hypothetical protein